MALFDLNRSNDTPVATLLLAEITPDVFPTLPEPTPDTDPIYVPVITYYGGAFGDDVDVATANATMDYAPRTQAAKAALMVPAGELAVDVTRTRGWIGPLDPYSAPVTPTGTGFTTYTKAEVDGVEVPTTYVSPTSIIATVTPRATIGTQLVTAVDHSVTTAPQDFDVT